MYVIKVGDTYSPMLKFDFTVESNLMYIDQLQVSIDPTICVINRTLNLDGNPYSFAPEGDPFESPLLGPSYGQIMNIYVNMAWILTKLDELKDASSNKVVLIDLLNNMLSSINGALGGTTKLEASIDDSRNTVVIIDGNPLPNVQSVIATLNSAPSTQTQINDKYASFDLYGYNNNTGTGSASFIKDFSLTTEISPELSTMLTVGATANSTVVGENSTAFSKFNAGLKDRYKEEIVYVSPSINGEYKNGPIDYLKGTPLIDDGIKRLEEEIKIISLKYSNIYTAYKTYLKSLSQGTYNNDADTYKDALTNYITYSQQLRQAILIKTFKEKNIPLSKLPNSFTPGTGFIPFNMSLTMDGLSGMKIYNKFFIDTDFLPANYPNNAEFLIKNVAHKIENNKWVTTLESVVISKGEEDPKVLNSKIDIGGTTQNQINYNVFGPVKYGPSTNDPNANKLRSIILNLGYKEKYNEIDSGGGISNELLIAATSIFTTIKQTYPNLGITITSGNDVYHQNLQGNSSHKSGKGLDFKIDPYPTNKDLFDITNILIKYGATNPKFYYENEYKTLSKNGTAPHFHIQIK